VKTLSGKEMARVLERRGWNLLRVKGSHHVYGLAGSTLRISVPVHGNHPLKIGLQRHFMRLAGIPAEEL
jgi:predicted RNA binding protein YcfA (HicA-like mRNA interferase family)